MRSWLLLSSLAVASSIGCGGRTAGSDAGETTTSSTGASGEGSAGSSASDDSAGDDTSSSSSSSSATTDAETSEVTTGVEETGVEESESEDTGADEVTSEGSSEGGFVDDPCDTPGMIICSEDWSHTLICGGDPADLSWQVDDDCQEEGWGWCMEACDFSPPGCIHTTICDWECFDRTSRPGGACVLELQFPPWILQESLVRIDGVQYAYIGQETCDGFTGDGWAGAEDSETILLCGEACDAWIGTKQAEFGHYCIAE